MLVRVDVLLHEGGELAAEFVGAIGEVGVHGVLDD
jgi:hypothetical protein